jgi:hypothetical protein
MCAALPPSMLSRMNRCAIRKCESMGRHRDGRGLKGHTPQADTEVTAYGVPLSRGTAQARQNERTGGSSIGESTYQNKHDTKWLVCV